MQLFPLFLFEAETCSKLVSGHVNMMDTFLGVVCTDVKLVASLMEAVVLAIFLYAMTAMLKNNAQRQRSRSVKLCFQASGSMYGSIQPFSRRNRYFLDCRCNLPRRPLDLLLLVMEASCGILFVSDGGKLPPNMRNGRTQFLRDWESRWDRAQQNLVMQYKKQRTCPKNMSYSKTLWSCT